MNKGISEDYIKIRDKVLKYSYQEMNLQLENDNQVYIAVVDMPVKSIINKVKSRTLALVFGLNTHIYQNDGNYLVGLEKNPNVMKAMQSLLISSSQVLDKMSLVSDYSFYESNNIRVYLKTRSGIFFKEIDNISKEDRFLKMLIDNVLKAISEC